MSSLPVAALLATWLDAFRAGQLGPDDLADAVRGDDVRHLVSGLGEGGTRELYELPALLDGQISLALPAPGDPLGLGGPEELNFAALDAGQAVVVGAVGLVPVEDARTVVWTAYPAGRVPWVDERDTAIELRTTLARGHPSTGRPRRRVVAAGDPRPADERAPPATTAPASGVRRPADRDPRTGTALPRGRGPGPRGRRWRRVGVRDRPATMPPSATWTVLRGEPSSAPARAARAEPDRRRLTSCRAGRESTLSSHGPC